MKPKKIHQLDKPFSRASELPDETENDRPHKLKECTDCAGHGYTKGKKNGIYVDLFCNKCAGTGIIKYENIQKKRFAIDFDNTLTIGDNKPWLEDDRPTPNKKNINIVNQLFFKGNTIIIHSSRPWEFARKTVAWLIENGVLYHGINFNKANAHIYVDDRNMSIKEFEALK